MNIEEIDEIIEDIEIKYDYEKPENLIREILEKLNIQRIWLIRLYEKSEGKPTKKQKELILKIKEKIEYLEKLEDDFTLYEIS